ncbi:MAG: hypothetical protein R3F05_01500 [Planctomycetota bacterium]
MPVDDRDASPDRAPRAPWTALVVLLLLAGVVTFLVATLGGSNPTCLLAGGRHVVRSWCGRERIVARR